jgi:hypothetical protein
MTKAGDFYLEPTAAAAAKNMAVLTTSRAYADMAEIAVQWFRKAPKKMHHSIGIHDGKSQPKSVPLTGETLVGTW